MPNLTLAIPEELKKKMDQFKEINWSEVARQAILEKTEMLEKMNQLLAKSKLDPNDVMLHGKQINQSVLRKNKGK